MQRIAWTMISTLIVGAALHAPAATAQTLLIQARRYLDVDKGVYVSPAAILIDGERIAAINPPAMPAGVQTIELRGMTILPGLMDAHTHLTFDIEPGWESEPARWSAADFALRGAANARKTLDAGFTTVRDVGAPGFADVALAHAIDRGWIVGPRVIPSAHALGITGGHCDVTGFAPGVLATDSRSGIADGADELTKAARYQIKHGAKVIKICATAGVLSFEGPAGAQQPTFEEMKAVADEAHRHGLKVAAHAHGTEGIIAASRAGIDSIDHGTLLTEAAVEVLKENGTYLVSTLYIARAIDWSTMPAVLAEKGRTLLPRADASFQLAVRRGVKIAFGTDSGAYPHGDNAKEFSIRVQLGQSSLDAIRSATVNTADLFGVADRGRVAVGLLADLIAVDGDPLADITELESVEFVLKGGEIVKQP